VERRACVARLVVNMCVGGGDGNLSLRVVAFDFKKFASVGRMRPPDTTQPASRRVGWPQVEVPHATCLGAARRHTRFACVRQ